MRLGVRRRIRLTIDATPATPAAVTSASMGPRSADTPKIIDFSSGKNILSLPASPDGQPVPPAVGAAAASDVKKGEH